MDCQEPYDYEIGLNERLDINVSFAEWLQDQGNPVIVNRTVTASPEIRIVADELKNFNQDVVIVVETIQANRMGWGKVLITTNKVLPNSEIQTKEATVVFRTVEHVTGQRLP